MWKVNWRSIRDEWDKYFYTAYLILTTLAYGIIFSLFSNIMTDMRLIFKTSLTMMTLYQTLETVGYILGTFVGLTYRYLNRQLVVAVCFVILTVVNSVLPMVPNLPVLYVCAVASGFCSSVIMCSYTVWTMEMWGSRSAPVLYLEDFSYGIGSTIVSAVLKPFVVGDVEAGREAVTTTLAPLVGYGLNNTIDRALVSGGSLPMNDDYDRRALLTQPFIIIGVCVIPG
ncbi:unnamed protein product [Medioppia subpectinata]|uniref:Uncharacterized protein n=1 Tax=Medioppia subpectinata TaxID=1979941 RepID=A0A7R9L777_9ACAR|nr:unnamed protein product [Medioppia subpectinata]CAG2116658.1 unnamed protein product [Medioppia subpectinata]